MVQLKSGVAIEHFSRIDSTSAEAKRRAEKGERGPFWLIADEQTAGYGRRARGWQTDLGNFAGTLLIEPKSAPATLAQLSFVTAVSVHAALSAFARSDALKLKWPNDVLCDGGKIAGLLLERIDTPGWVCIAIGIGVNLIAAPSGMPYQTATLRSLVTDPPSTLHFLDVLDEHFWRIYGEWIDGGFAPIRAAWLEAAAGVGENIIVRFSDRELTGIFEGIDETGALLLRNEAGVQEINAGEIFFS